MTLAVGQWRTDLATGSDIPDPGGAVLAPGGDESRPSWLKARQSMNPWWPRSTCWDLDRSPGLGHLSEPRGTPFGVMIVCPSGEKPRAVISDSRGSGGPRRRPT